MPDLRTLGRVASPVNLLDTTKYRVPRSSEVENKVYEVIYNPIRNTALINMANVDYQATELSMDVWVSGSGWDQVLTNYAAIQSELDAAALYSVFGTGTEVYYKEQAGNQAVETTYTVKWGRIVEDRTRRSEPRLQMVGKLTIFCEPLT